MRCYTKTKLQRRVGGRKAWNIQILALKIQRFTLELFSRSRFWTTSLGIYSLQIPFVGIFASLARSLSLSLTCGVPLSNITPEPTAMLSGSRYATFFQRFKTGCSDRSDLTPSLPPSFLSAPTFGDFIARDICCINHSGFSPMPTRFACHINTQRYNLFDTSLLARVFFALQLALLFLSYPFARFRTLFFVERSSVRVISNVIYIFDSKFRPEMILQASLISLFNKWEIKMKQKEKNEPASIRRAREFFFFAIFWICALRVDTLGHFDPKKIRGFWELREAFWGIWLDCFWIWNHA